MILDTFQSSSVKIFIDGIACQGLLKTKCSVTKIKDAKTVLQGKQKLRKIRKQIKPEQTKRKGFSFFLNLVFSLVSPQAA